MFNIILSTVISRHFTITVILSEQPHLALFQMHNLARELRKKNIVRISITEVSSWKRHHTKCVFDISNKIVNLLFHKIFNINIFYQKHRFSLKK